MPFAPDPPPDHPPAGPALHLHLCGEPAFTRGAGPAVPLEPKDALLLALLAIEGPTPRARLAALLWPDVDRERARTNLRQRLLRLRRALGVDLLREGEVTALREDLCTDLSFALESAEGKAPEPPPLRPLLGSVVLDGTGQCSPEAAAWLAAARARHIEQQADHLARCSSAFEERGELVAALQWAQQLARLQPASEHAHRRVMRLHHLRGDRAAALAAYERCVQTLDEERGMAPSSETRALARQIDSEPDTPQGAARPVPVTILRPPRLIGRHDQWEALEAAWTRGAAALVLGEAGMGKTRLVGDFAAARRGVQRVVARPGDARVPYALLTRLLQALLPTLHAPLAAGEAQELARLLPALGAAPAADPDVPAGQARFLNAVQALLSRAADPRSAAPVTGVVLDDVHFADGASVEAVQTLIGSDSPVRWILASRPGELPPATQALCDELLRGAAAVAVPLSALTEPEVHALIVSLAIDGLDAAQLAPRLTRRTGGNPMFLLETIKAIVLQPAAPAGPAPPPVASHWPRAAQAGTALQAPAGTLARRVEPAVAALPAVATVTDLILRRIAQLSPDAVRLARCAAVTGPDFTSELAAQVLGVRPLDMADAWNELEAAQVFRGGVFAHDLIYEAALASVPAPIARLLHGQIARYLEATGHAPARVVQHWLEAGELARGAEALLGAAQEAGRLMRLPEQAQLLERAAATLKTLGDRRRCYDTLLQLQEVYSAVGTVAQRDHVYAALMTVADTDEQRCAAVAERITTLANIGRSEEALALGRASIDGAIADGVADALVAELRTRLGATLAATGRVAEAESQFLLAQPSMRGHADPRVRAAYFGEFAAFLDNAGRHREARLAHQAAVEGARACGDIGLLVSVTANLGVSFMDSGLHRLAADALHEAIRLRQAHDLPAAANSAWLTLGQVQRSIGAYRDALHSTQEQRNYWRGENAALVCVCDHSLASSYLHLGQHARARQALKASVVSDQLPAGIRAKFLVVCARLAAALGQPVAPLLAQAEAMLSADEGHGGYWRQLQLEWALVLEPAEGLARARAVLAAAQGSEQYGAQISAHTRCAAAALRMPDPAAAQAHAQQALDLLAVYDPDDLYRAEVTWTAWRAFSAAGAPGAPAVLAQTAAWIDEIARTQVPEAFRASFLTRNPVNRAVANAVGRR